MKEDMDRKWVFNRDLDSVAGAINSYDNTEMVIKSLRVRSNSILFGCYIPTVPRPTSIISAKILLTRLAGNRTELIATNIQEWAIPFIDQLISSLSEDL